MQRVVGKFDIKNFALVIDLDINQEKESDLYKKIKRYYTFNMFISFRPQAAKLRKVLISSVGDHLDENDEQSTKEADLWLNIDLDKSTPISEDMMLALDKFPNWYIIINAIAKTNIQETINILIRKTDGYIIRDQY